MMLGDLLAQLDDEATACEALLSVNDVALIAEVERVCEVRGQPVGAVVSEAMVSFLQNASPDDWLAAMTAASGSNNPGGALLKTVLAARCAFERSL